MGDVAVLVIVSAVTAAAIHSRRELYILAATAAYTATIMYLVLTAMPTARYAVAIAVVLALQGLVTIGLQALSEASARRRAGTAARVRPRGRSGEGPAEPAARAISLTRDRTDGRG